MLYKILLITLILDSVLLATVVLLQAGQGGGLAALGGSGTSTESIFGGRQAVTILTKTSWWCGGIFLLISIVLAGLSTRGGAPRSVLEGQLSPPLPVVPLPLDLDQSSGGFVENAAPTQDP